MGYLMTSLPSTVNIPLLRLEPASAVPRYQQINDALREAMLVGQLAPGTRVPAPRALAAAVGLSRNTVVSALAQLMAEGYLEGKVGAGTTVAARLPDDLLRARRTDPPRTPDALPTDRPLSPHERD